MNALLVLLGSGLVAVAVLAYPLGLALDPKWGRGQSMLLAFGLLLIGLGLGLLFKTSLIAATRHLELSAGSLTSQVRQSVLFRRWADRLDSWAAFLAASPPGRLVRAAANSRLSLYLRRHPTIRLTALALLAVVLVELLYLWFVSVGFWTGWPGTTDYYDRLGVAFRHGQLYLEDRPHPALSELADPYNPARRGAVPVLWDATLYQGKYYLYWGPVPALIVAALRQFIPHQIGDAQLVLGFTTGSFLLSLLILLHFRRRFFNLQPLWLFLLAALAAGLNYPILWLLSRPAVYEVALASGQFFLLAGFYALLKAFDRPQPSAWRLALAGALWACAIGSRTSLALGIAFLVSVAGLRLLLWSGNSKRLQKTLPGLLCLSVPMLLGAAGLGWYNWARFGSVLEFGHRYQITGMNLNQIYPHVFSIANIWPNLHNYLLNPYASLNVFPFIKPQWGLQGLLFRLPIPQPFYSEQVTGLIPAAPILLLALIPSAGLGIRWLRQLRLPEKPSKMPDQPAASALDWNVASLAGGTAFLFAADLGYVVSTMRYLADVSPCLALLASLGLWQGYSALGQRAFWRRIFSLSAAALAVYTCLVGLLLAVTGYLSRFEHLNPDLFDRLTRLFTW